MSIIKGDSLLSNLSNISVMIKPGNNSSMFNLPGLTHSYDHDSQKMCEAKFQDIFPDAPPDNNSMLERIIRKDDSCLPMQSPILPHFTNFSQPFN